MSEHNRSKSKQEDAIGVRVWDSSASGQSCWHAAEGRRETQESQHAFISSMNIFATGTFTLRSRAGDKPFSTSRRCHVRARRWAKHVRAAARLHTGVLGRLRWIGQASLDYRGAGTIQNLHTHTRTIHTNSYH